MTKNLVILGSTGSIGRSALDVVAGNKDRINILGLAAHSNVDILLKQCEAFHPRFVTLSEPSSYKKLKNSLNLPGINILEPDRGGEMLASLPEADIVLNAIVGAAGLKPSLAAVRAGKRLALANKESMVIGGPLINKAVVDSGAEIIPVDSEHSAIWQVLKAGKKSEIRKILLTGSGGPFRDLPSSEFDHITKEMALKHPTWNMGPKITIDSATMMNKGLEVIEAVHLFDLAPDQIEVLIHPQSIVHSLVEFRDSSIIAQLSKPDMKLPIALALFYPDRVESAEAHADLTKIGSLTFQPPDRDKFPLLPLAYEVANTGGTMPAVFNAANEIAVDAFLNDRIKFRNIPEIIRKTVDKHRSKTDPALEDILAADNWARYETGTLIK